MNEGSVARTELVLRNSAILDLDESYLAAFCQRHRVKRLAVFGSRLRGSAGAESDLDLLVDAIEGTTTLTSLVRIRREIESLTGVHTDVVTPMGLRERYREAVLAEARPV